MIDLAAGTDDATGIVGVEIIQADGVERIHGLERIARVPAFYRRRQGLRLGCDPGRALLGGERRATDLRRHLRRRTAGDGYATNAVRRLRRRTAGDGYATNAVRRLRRRTAVAYFVL